MFLRNGKFTGINVCLIYFFIFFSKKNKALFTKNFFITNNNFFLLFNYFLIENSYRLVLDIFSRKKKNIFYINSSFGFKLTKILLLGKKKTFSLSKIFGISEWYERESSEYEGTTFSGLKDSRNLLMPYNLKNKSPIWEATRDCIFYKNKNLVVL